MKLLLKLYKVIIGVEIHVKINSKKIFSNSSNCTILEMAIPGILPILNYSLIIIIIFFFFKINGCFFLNSLFERKMYFYCDLAKNYQITQNNYQNFFNVILLNYCKKKILIKKIHLEEDAASIKKKNFLTIDYFRIGNSLLEIVSEPLFNNYYCLILFIKKIFYFLKNNNISNCNFYEGNIRIDLNISIMNKINLKKTNKHEIKNLNSLDNIKKSIIYELKNLILKLELNLFKKKSTRSFENDKTKKIRNYISKYYDYIIDFDLGMLTLFINNFLFKKNNKIIYKKKIFDFLPKKKYLNIFKKNFIKKNFSKNKFLLYIIKNKIYNNNIIYYFNLIKIINKEKKKILIYFKKKILFKIKKNINLFNFL